MEKQRHLPEAWYLKAGDKVEVNADEGVVTVLE